jgi:hypothetical protein
MGRETRRKRSERLQIMLNTDELEQVDDFRFKTRMPSRASAVRQLLKRGLTAEGFLSARSVRSHPTMVSAVMALRDALNPQKEDSMPFSLDEVVLLLADRQWMD